MPQIRALSNTPAKSQTPPTPARTSVPMPFAGSWPIPGDAPDLNSIVLDQAATITQQEALLHAYQGVLNAAQITPPPATGNGASSGTNQLTVSGSSGTILQYAAITGAINPATGVAIISQTSGTPGGDGVYTTNVASTATGALTFTNASPPQWPVPQDAPTLNLIVQQQTAVLRVQTALIQHYQDLLNTSQTAPPASGP